MSKLVLMSVVLATVVIPAITARDAFPRRALKRTVLALVAFNVLYAFLVIFVYPQICWN